MNWTFYYIGRKSRQHTEFKIFSVGWVKTNWAHILLFMENKFSRANNVLIYVRWVYSEVWVWVSFDVLIHWSFLECWWSLTSVWDGYFICFTIVLLFNLLLFLNFLFNIIFYSLSSCQLGYQANNNCSRFDRGVSKVYSVGHGHR